MFHNQKFAGAIWIRKILCLVGILCDSYIRGIFVNAFMLTLGGTNFGWKGIAALIDTSSALQQFRGANHRVTLPLQSAGCR